MIFYSLGLLKQNYLCMYKICIKYVYYGINSNSGSGSDFGSGGGFCLS